MAIASPSGSHPSGDPHFVKRHLHASCFEAFGGFRRLQGEGTAANRDTVRLHSSFSAVPEVTTISLYGRSLSRTRSYCKARNSGGRSVCSCYSIRWERNGASRASCCIFMHLCGHGCKRLHLVHTSLQHKATTFCIFLFYSSVFVLTFLRDLDQKTP